MSRWLQEAGSRMVPGRQLALAAALCARLPQTKEAEDPSVERPLNPRCRKMVRIQASELGRQVVAPSPPHTAKTVALAAVCCSLRPEWESTAN